jgi:ADP-heptose:LPS heptosyltransferase
MNSPVVAIHTGPTWPVKEWGALGWNSLVSSLKKRANATIIQIGSDVDSGRGVMRSLPVSGAVDWVNRFTLEEAAALVSQADLFVGIDSGLLHIAGAVGTPTVGLYGASNPELSLPPTTPSIGVTSDVCCLGCHHRLPIGHWRTGCPHGITCMRELPPDRVAAACERLLGTTAGTQCSAHGLCVPVEGAHALSARNLS